MTSIFITPGFSGKNRSLNYLGWKLFNALFPRTLESFARRFATHDGSNSISVIDTATNTVKNTIQSTPAPYGITVAPDGKHIYVANIAGTVSIINTSDFTMNNVSVGSGDEFVAVTPDGKSIYVTNSGDNTVSVIDTTTLNLVATIGVGSTPYGVAIQSVISKPESWVLPLSSPTIQQDFDCYNCIGNNKFHTGIDMTSSSAIVTPARDGIIQDIYTTTDTKNNAWCDLTKDNIDKLSTNNHGYGNTIILRHPNGIYTQYSHLNCIYKDIGERFLDSKTTGILATVATSESIGKMGNSCLDSINCIKKWGVHLHFEMKNFDGLAPPNESFWGYAPNLSENYGYLDPMLFIHQPKIHNESITGIVLNKNIITIGPDEYQYNDLITNSLSSGTEVFIKRIAFYNDEKWYQINLGVPYNTYNEGKIIDNNSPDGWVHSDYVNEYYGFTTSIKKQNKKQDKEIGAKVYDNSKKTPIAYVFDGQSFPVISVSNPNKGENNCDKQWLNISLGEINIDRNNSVTSGWICSSNTDWTN